MAERYIRKCSKSLAIREMRINNTEIPLSAWLRSKTPMTVYAGDYVEKGEHHSTAGRNANLYGHLGNQYGNSSGKRESVYNKIQKLHS